MPRWFKKSVGSQVVPIAPTEPVDAVNGVVEQSLELEDKDPTEGHEPGDRHNMESIASEVTDDNHENSGDSIVVWHSPEVYAFTIAAGSPIHEATRRLQAQRFAQVQGARSAASAEGGSYVDITDNAPERTIPIAVYRASRAPWTESDDDELIGTARLELAGATLIEHMIRLQPDSPTARAFSEQTVAEIGGFAVAWPHNRSLLLDIIDAIVAVMVKVARVRHLQTIMVFPRNGFMSLMRAEISGLLPPYNFQVCQDVAEWDEESEQLAQFRALGLRGLGKNPDIFYISVDDLATDLAARQALIAKRREFGQDLDRLLPRAMVHAQRGIHAEVAHWRGTQSILDGASREAVEGSLGRATLSPTLTTSVPVPETQEAHEQLETAPGIHRITQRTAAHENGRSAQAQAQGQPGFLPFGAAADVASSSALASAESAEAQYLRTVATHGGSPVQAYKRLSYQMLGVEPRMHVLDVGCGTGDDDLPALAALVGEEGVVVGIDRDPALVVSATQTIVNHGLANAWVFERDAEHLSFASDEFDRVRADRAVQHMQHPDLALAEMWRVLRPGGVVTIIEPDWQSIVVSPASQSGGNDDSAFQRVIQWCRDHLANPLIGRELRALLSRQDELQGGHAWSSLQVYANIYTYTDWHMLDAVLKLSQVAMAIEQEATDDAPMVAAWLDAVRTADQRSTFFAAVPLFFAVARKSSTGGVPTQS